MSNARRPTLNDLATDLGLSANTVSRALANKDGVSPRTRELVQRTAELRGYVAPKARSRSIALTVTSSTNVFIQQFIPAVEAALRAQGYTVSLRITEESAEVEAEAISAMLRSDCAAAIVIPVQGAASGWSQIKEIPFPIVAVAREIPGLRCDLVALDHRGGLEAATRHVLAGGGRSLLYVDEELDITTVQLRVDAFESAVASVPGATGSVIKVPTRRFESRTVPWQPEEAYRAIRAQLDRNTEFDSILFANDYYALGALRALREHDLRVPHDVRVVGFGDHPYAQYLTPSLTSVQVPARVIAEAAVSLLLLRIAGDTSSPVHRLIPAELVVRESSVAPANASGVLRSVTANRHKR